MLSIILSVLLVASAHAQRNTIVKLSYCDYACAEGENCVDTGIRCVRAPCPTYQCRGNGLSAKPTSSSSSLYETLALLLAKLRGSPPPMSQNTVNKQQLPTPPQPQPTIQQLPSIVQNPFPLPSSSSSRSVRVVPDSYCSDKPCVFGEECVDTGIRCVRSPCPTFQCRRSSVSAPQDLSGQKLFPYQVIPEQQPQNPQGSSQGSGFSSDIPMLSQFGAPERLKPVFPRGAHDAYPLPSTNLVMENSNPGGLQQPFKYESLFITKPAERKTLTVADRLELLRKKQQRSSKKPTRPSPSVSAVSQSFKRSDVVPGSYCEDRCGATEVCVQTPLRCFRGPCPEVFKCVQDQAIQSRLDEKPACTRACNPAEGWYCGLEQSCRRGNDCHYIQICNKIIK